MRDLVAIVRCVIQHRNKPGGDVSVFCKTWLSLGTMVVNMYWPHRIFPIRVVQNLYNCFADSRINFLLWLFLLFFFRDGWSSNHVSPCSVLLLLSWNNNASKGDGSGIPEMDVIRPAVLPQPQKTTKFVTICPTKSRMNTGDNLRNLCKTARPSADDTLDSNIK